jgi:hypothetical protein
VEARRLAVFDQSDPHFSVWHIRDCTLGLEAGMSLILGA